MRRYGAGDKDPTLERIQRVFSYIFMPSVYSLMVWPCSYTLRKQRDPLEMVLSNTIANKTNFLNITLYTVKTSALYERP